MGWFAVVIAAIGITAGIVKGSFAAAASEDTHNAQRAAYQAEIDKSQDQYDLLVDQIENEKKAYEMSRDQMMSDKWSAEVERDVSSEANARAGVLSNQQAYDTLTEANREASSAEGSFRQSVATSGFRNTGTMARMEDIQERTYDRALAGLEERAGLTVLGTYLSAGGTRQQQDNAIAAYATQLEINKMNWDLRLEELTLSRDQAKANRDYYQGLYDSMGEWNEWLGVRDFFAGMF